MMNGEYSIFACRTILVRKKEIDSKKIMSKSHSQTFEGAFSDSENILIFM